MATKGDVDRGIGLSSKKLKRMESKKRKIEAFLELCGDSETDRGQSVPAAVKKPRSTDGGARTEPAGGTADAAKSINAELSELRALRRAHQSSRLQIPKFYMTEDGYRAGWSWPTVVEDDATEKVEQPSNVLYLQDVQNLLLVALMGNETPYLTRWCRYLRNAKTSHIVVVTVSGLSVDMLSENPSWFPKLNRLFPDGGVRVVPADQYGATTECELTQVPVSFQAGIKLRCAFGSLEAAEAAGAVFKCYGAFVPIANRTHSAAQNGQVSEGGQNPSRGSDELEEGQLEEAEEITLGNANPNDVVPRTLFLLSPVQMLHEGYPLLRTEATKDYVYTNRSYLPVSNKSRLFAIDCEMCLTTAKCNELARVTLVDEDEKVLLDQLVKPRNRIINYLTQFSGITKEMLEPVTTRVEDVQKAIIRLLPPDAILVGQSLNFDLHALHMIHPYVIDSSVIFNLTGNRNHKSKLKLLSSTFLGQDIQMSKAGHSSEEDSLACLRLVKLRLQKGLFFGDAILRDKEQELQEKALEMARSGEAIDVSICSDPPQEWAECKRISEPKATIKKGGSKVNPRTSECKRMLKDEFRGLVSNLFYYLGKDKHKKTAHVVGTKEMLENYPKFVLDVIQSREVSGNKKAVQGAKALMDDNHLLVVGLKARGHKEPLTRQKAAELDKQVEKIYRGCQKKSLFLVLLQGSFDKDTRVTEHGLCFVKVKEAERRSQADKKE
ncbi:unnamed protein product [Ixodes hexagonus]